MGQAWNQHITSSETHVGRLQPFVAEISYEGNRHSHYTNPLTKLFPHLFSLNNAYFNFQLWFCTWWFCVFMSCQKVSFQLNQRNLRIIEVEMLSWLASPVRHVSRWMRGQSLQLSVVSPGWTITTISLYTQAQPAFFESMMMFRNFPSLVGYVIVSSL